jgi:hypothetical protein
MTHQPDALISLIMWLFNGPGMLYIVIPIIALKKFFQILKR